MSSMQFAPRENRSNHWRFAMNKDQVKGAVKDAAGKVQQKTGEAVGSTEHQVKGLAKQAEGKAQKSFGDAKEALKDANRH